MSLEGDPSQRRLTASWRPVTIEPMSSRLARFALLACALASAAAAAAATPPTSLHLYSPFAGSGLAAGVRVSKTAAGYCWTSSSSTAQLDAYRCFVGNEIYDPCFHSAAAGERSSVLCPLYRPGSSLLRIELTRKLPAPGPRVNPERYTPWALETENGRWCTLFTGATSTIQGLPMSYGCQGGGFLLGDPSRARPGWTIHYAASATTHTVTVAGLRSAWW
jgi:hypothetical protein